jgi:hypothetical protein
VSATGAGHLLVVGTANDNSQTAISVSDGTNSFTQAPNTHGVDQNPHDTNMYYLLSSTAGKTTITATFSGAAAAYTREIWFWEVSGFTNPQYDGGNHTQNLDADGSGVSAGDVTTTTSTTGFIAAVISYGAAVTQNPKTGNEFTAGGDLVSTGDASASLISTTAAQHQPVWVGDTANASFATSTAAFREGPSGLPYLVQSFSYVSTANSASAALPVESTGSGNLLVVAASDDGSRTVSSVTDGTHSFKQVTNAAATNQTTRTDIWYLASSATGTTTVTVTFSGAAGTFAKELWFWEVRGINNPVVDAVAHTSAGAQSGGIATGAAVTTTGSADFVAAIDESSNMVSEDPTSGNEFVYGGSTDSNGNAACSLITTSASAHTPQWTDAGSSFANSTVAFKAGPSAIRHRVRQ